MSCQVRSTDPSFQAFALFKAAAIKARFAVLKVSPRRFVVIERAATIKHNQVGALCHFKVVSERLDYSSAVDLAMKKVLLDEDAIK